MSLPRSRGSILALMLVISASCTDHADQLGGPNAAQLGVNAGIIVTIAPSSVTLTHVGATTTLTATAVNPAGNPVNANLKWRAEPEGVVESLGNGQFRAVGYGTATVYVSVGSSPHLATATITVTQGVANIALSPVSSTLDARGATVQITAVATDGSGTVIPTPSLVWSSSDHSVATVDQNGLVTAVNDGPVTINAAAGTVSANAHVIVDRRATQFTEVAGNNQNGVVGAQLAQPLVVQALDRLGHGVDGVAVTFSASAGTVAPTTATTAADGRAETRWTLGSQIGAQEMRASATGFSDVVFSANAQAGNAVSMVIHAGNEQSATVGTDVAVDPAVRVTDAFGNPLANITVAFSVVMGGGTVTGETATTDANGVATLGSWTLGTIRGANTLTASLAPLAPVTFMATGTPDVAHSITIQGGNGQSAQIGTELPAPLGVRVADQYGNPVGDVEVTFTPVSSGSANPATAITGTKGLTYTRWTLGTQPGTQELRASVPGLTPATFTANGEGGIATTVIIHAGDGQAADAGAAVTVAPAVRVTDSFNQPVANVAVTFEVVSGAGTITGANATTDATGVAAVGSWTLGAGGTNELRATVAGLPPVVFTATANVTERHITLTLNDAYENVGVTFNAPLTITLSAPAPLGGVVVALASSNTAKLRIAAPGSVTIPQGATQGTIMVVGVEAGEATVTATAPGHTDGQLLVSVSLRLISLPLTVDVPYGRTGSLPIQLASPAPAGGVVVNIVSEDETRVRVLTPTVTIPAGTILGSATVEGAMLGTATVTANAPGYIGATSQVTTQASLDITQTQVRINASFGGEFTVRLRSAGNPIAAPAGGVPVTFTATAPACANVPATATIPEGLTEINVPVSYGGTATLTCNTVVTATAENIVSDNVTIRVDPTPVITFGITSVGTGLQRAQTVSVGTTIHDGITIRITSADASKLVLATNASTAGTAAIDLPLAAGTNSTTFYAQSVDGTGAVGITGTATRVTGTSGTINVVPAMMDISGLNLTTTTFTGADLFTVRIGVGNASGLTELQSVRAGGTPAVISLVSETPAVAALTTSAGTGANATVEIAPEENTSPSALTLGGVQLTPLSAGSTIVRATSPVIVSTPGATRTVTVSAPALTLTSSPVGAGLMRSQSVSLGSATHGGITVRLTSSDPARLLLSVDATSASAPFIDVPLLNGVGSLSYFAHAIEGATGSVTVTATAPAFTSGSTNIAIGTAAIDLTGVLTAMTTTTPDDPFAARIGVGNTSGLTELQSVRTGGPGFNITFTIGTATAATLVTSSGTSSSVVMALTSGNQTPTTVAAGGIAMRPLTGGSVTVSASGPGLLSTSAATRTVTITDASISMNSTAVGAGLQRAQSGNLSGSDHGGVTVRVRSSQPDRMLIALNATSVGGEFVDIPVANGSTTFSYVAQAIEGATGPVAVTASATGFEDGTTNITVQEAALDITGLATTQNTLGADDPFTVRVGVANSANTGMVELQNRRFGAPAFIATVTSSTTAGQVVTTAGRGGSGTTQIVQNTSTSPSTVALGGVAFDPFTTGTSVVSATIPGVRSLPTASVSVTVNAASMTLNAVTVGAGLQRVTSGSLSSAAHGGVTVHVTSSNSGVALVSPNESTAGTGSIDIFVPNNTSTFSYYVHGLEGAVATVEIRATAPGFSDATTTAAVVQPGLDISALSTATTMITPADLFTVRIGIPNSTATSLVELQAVRAGGAPLAVTVTSSNEGVGRLATSTTSGAVVSLSIPARASATGSTLAAGGVQLVPVSPGTVTISAAIPDYILTAGDRTVVVSGAALTVNPVTVGAGLQRATSFSLNGTNHGGTRVLLTSSDPSRLLLSPNATTAGTATIEMVVANGSSTLTFFTQGVESTSGSIGVQATATGFTNGSATIEVVQPGFDISGLVATTTSAAANDPFTIRVGVPNSLLTGLNELQDVRAGSPGLTATITSSVPAVGTLVTSAGTAATVTSLIPAGSSATASTVATGGVAFDPISVGNTSVSAAIPGLRVLPTSTVAVRVN